MRERMLAGDPYIAHDPELAAASTRARELITAYNATSVREESLRASLLGELLGSVGDGTHIRPPLYVDYGSHISASQSAWWRRSAFIPSASWMTTTPGPVPPRYTGRVTPSWVKVVSVKPSSAAIAAD